MRQQSEGEYRLYIATHISEVDDKAQVNIKKI